MKIDHIGIQVNNISESVDYYKEYGSEVIHQDDTWAFLQFDNIKLALVLEDEHPYHIAFESEYVDGKRHRDGSVSKYIEDPSGNKIEIIKYENKKWASQSAVPAFNEILNRITNEDRNLAIHIEDEIR